MAALERSKGKYLFFPILWFFFYEQEKYFNTQVSKVSYCTFSQKRSLMYENMICSMPCFIEFVIIE